MKLEGVCAGVWWTPGLPVSVLPAAGPAPAAASETQPSAPSLSDRLRQPGAVPPPTRPPAAVASDLTGRPDCGSFAALVHDPLTNPNVHWSTALSGFNHLVLIIRCCNILCLHYPIIPYQQLRSDVFSKCCLDSFLSVYTYIACSNSNYSSRD